MLITVASGSLMAQQQVPLSLQAAIAEAQQKSIRSKVAQTRQQLGRFQYDIFKSELKPQISLYGNIPGFGKEFATVTQPDGTISFEPVQQSLSSFGVGLTQRIAATGGEISFNSDLSRFRDIRTKNTLYNATPVFVRLQQPLLAVNPLRWQKRIEPLKLQEAELTYGQELLTLAADVTTLFFEVAEAQADAAIAAQNLKNTEDNYALEQKRIGLGTTTEDKLLQLELQVLNSRQQLQQANYRNEMGLLALRNLLGIADSLPYTCLLPDALPANPLSLEEALQKAHANRPEWVAFERKRLEAQQQVAEAKAARQQVNLIASYGLNRADPLLSTVYGDPQSQQRFNIGFNVPIVNWGRRQAALKTAQAIEQLTLYTNAIDQQTFDQELVTLYNNLNLLRKNIQLANSTDSVAARRYELSNRLYQSGKLTITDLTLAQAEKDAARRAYITALRQFWEAWYAFKRVTGWAG
jgi:outer membrane protein TolC